MHIRAFLAVALVVSPLLTGVNCTSTGPASVPAQRNGIVATVDLDSHPHPDAVRARRLHFCVFENGDEDYIYVGVGGGMWMDGSFDLEVDGAVVFTGRVQRLLYEGTTLRTGNVIDGPLQRSRPEVRITNVAGNFQ